MINISSTIKTVKTLVTANSPVLLVGTAIAGVVSTGVLAAKGGYKARGIIDTEREARKPTITPNVESKSVVPDLTLQEKVQLTWKCYTVPALTGASTIASVVGVHTIHTKRHAALAGLYAMTTAKLDEHIEKAEEILGPKKTQALNNNLSQQAVDANPLGENEIIMTGDHAELCYDGWSGRYFMSSLPAIESAFNHANNQIRDEGDCSLNDFYEFLGLAPVPMGTHFGWSGAEQIKPQITSVVAAGGRPAIAVAFRNTPTHGMGQCP